MMTSENEGAMILERDVTLQKVLKGKRALLLSTGGDTMSELALKLAVEGCSVLALSGTQAELEILNREVRDIGGEFNYRVIDLMDENQVREAATQAFQEWGGANFIIDDSDTAHSRYWWNEYIGSVTEHGERLSLEHVIMVNRAIAIDDTAIEGIPLVSLRANPHSVQYTVVTDGLYINTRRANSRERNPAQSYSAMMAREVINRLSLPEYDNVEFISLHGVGDDVFARLYVLDDDGEFEAGKPKLEIRRGRILQTHLRQAEHGRGVFASRDFARGDLVFETHGKLLDHQTEHTIQIDWNLHLEPDSPVRMMNHSCSPSVGVKTNAYGLPDFYAFRDIKAGEEITFDYAMTEYTHYPRQDADLEFNLVCLCGSEKCRGKLGYYAELPDDIKDDYEGFVSDYLINGEQS